MYVCFLWRGLLAHRERVEDDSPTGAKNSGGAGYLVRTERGAQYLNDLQALFLPG